MATIPESLAVAVQHHQAGRLGQAEQIYRRVLEADSTQADALHLIGVIAHQTGRHQEAAEHIRRAVAVNSQAVAFHSNLGLVYQALGNLDEAVDCYRRALAIDPNFAAAHNNLGNALKEQGDLDEAAAAFRRALQLEPRYVEAHNNLAIVLKRQGHFDQAAASFERALQIQPGYADALANLAGMYERHNRAEEAAAVLASGLEAHPNHPHVNLVAAQLDQREGRFQEAIDRLERVRPLAKNNPQLSREISFLLARLHDRAGNSGRAFAEAVEANSLAMQCAEGWYADKQRYLRQIDTLQGVFTESWVSSWNPAPPSDGAETPVFLIGVPRSGTTLLDVVLDSHPGIQTLEEKPAVLRIQQAVEGRPGGYPRALADLGPDAIEELRTTYFREVDDSIERNAEQILVDKLPLNVVSTGLILRVFPSARFIMAVRHPYDVCLSGFLQNFKINPATANFFTLHDAATFYTSVMDLHGQYLRVLPHPCHVVRYEDLVRDFGAETRRMLEFVGVEWDDCILAYAERARRRGMINTPSYGQVTEPIYRRSCYRWQRYAEQLGPIVGVLKPYVERFGYEDAGPSSDDRSFVTGEG